MTAQRTKDWNEFATKVADHIENYTVPQYGDAPKCRSTPHVLVITNAPAKRNSTS